MAKVSLQGDAFVWHHITRPSSEDFAFVGEHFDLDEVDREVLQHGVDISRFHERGDWHLLALHIPAPKNAASDLAQTTLYVLFNKTTVVTVAEADSRLAKFFSKASKADVAKRLRHGTVLEVLAWLLGTVFDGVDQIVDDLFVRIREAEKRIAHAPSSKVAHRLGMLRRDVLMLDLMIEPQVSVMEQLLDTRTPYRGATAQARLRNLRDRLHGTHVVLQHYLKLIEGMFRVHESSLTHRTNRTVELLTAISVLLMPPTLIASYYGMNIAQLPFAHDYRIVTGLLLGAVAVFLLLVHLIYRKR